MSFRIGQKVRVIGVPHWKINKYIGAIGTIVSGPRPHPRKPEWTAQDVQWEENALEWTGRVGRDEPIRFLAPIDDPKPFERFMERVLKPVDLGVPVNA